MGKDVPPIKILYSSQHIPQELLVECSIYFVTVLWFEIATKNKKFLYISKDDLQKARKIGLGIGGGGRGEVVTKIKSFQSWWHLRISWHVCPVRAKLLTLAFYRVSCVGLRISCCLFCSVHREKHWHLMKNACKHTISKAFFDWHWS